MDEPNRVRVLTRDQIVWPWTGNPFVLLFEGEAAYWTGTVEVDPFPGYAHDPEVALRTLQAVEARFPLLFPPEIVLLEMEVAGRVQASVHHHEQVTEENYAEDRVYPYSSIIAISGKRGPSHPAVTRFIVAHEYGHLVERQMLYQAGKTERDPAIVHAYAERRGLTTKQRVRIEPGQRWHDRPNEIFADDFRILVAGAEGEHWPHPGIPRPETVDGLAEWWTDLQREALNGATNGRAN